MINNINSVNQNDNNNASNSSSVNSSGSTNSYFANMTSNTMNINNSSLRNSDMTATSSCNNSYYSCDTGSNMPSYTSTTKIQPAPIHSSIAIQMDSEVTRTASTISIKRNIKNYFEFKEKLGTYVYILKYISIYFKIGYNIYFN